MKIILAGGTGFIGKALRRELLGAGHEVIVLTRGASLDQGREKFVTWKGASSGDWVTHLDGADAVVNLAGENIAAKRWTVARKESLLSSRVDATRTIVEALAQVQRKPTVLINASAVGYYGDIPDLVLTEETGSGEGFLAATCERWESEARKAELSGVRVILSRFGPVLGDQGGMLSRMVPPFRFFVGAPLGTGDQWIPWIHREDVTGAILWMLEHPGLSGPVNLTAPAPVTMKFFSRSLAKSLHRPCWLPVPTFLIRTFLGEMATLVLGSQRALPQKLLRAGYRFRYPTLSDALAAIFHE